MTTYTFELAHTSISVDFHPAAGRGKAAILYFHGGGLLYGRRDDLDPAYIRAITEQGYHLFCFDYLLAPESPLAQIHASVDLALRWFLSRREELTGRCPYLLFGRSAGAYLALCLAHRLTRYVGERPAALWAFYGYHSLLHPFFSAPSSHYRGLPEISPNVLPDLRGAAPISSAPIEERFFLYVYARQQGKWPELLTQDPAEWTSFSIPEEDLGRLPPAFLTASTGDQDVPFSFSRKLSAQIPQSCLLRVFGLEHDYDRDSSLPESRALYQAALAWTDELLAGAP